VAAISRGCLGAGRGCRVQTPRFGDYVPRGGFWSAGGPPRGPGVQRGPLRDGWQPAGQLRLLARVFRSLPRRPAFSTRTEPAPAAQHVLLLPIPRSAPGSQPPLLRTVSLTGGLSCMVAVGRSPNLPCCGSLAAPCQRQPGGSGPPSQHPTLPRLSPVLSLLTPSPLPHAYNLPGSSRPRLVCGAQPACLAASRLLCRGGLGSRFWWRRASHGPFPWPSLSDPLHDASVSPGCPVSFPPARLAASRLLCRGGLRRLAVSGLLPPCCGALLPPFHPHSDPCWRPCGGVRWCPHA
jgi:hypothetical protein